MSEMSYSVLEDLKEIFQMDRSRIEHEFAPYFYQYFLGCWNSPLEVDKYGDYCKHIFDVTKADGKRVLDVGCGFGLISFFLATFGAQKVTSVDHNEEKVSVFHKILSQFNPALTNIEVRIEDGISLQCGDESFDVAIANDVIAHVRDLEAFVSEMSRVLTRGGILYISEGHISLNLFERLKSRRLWRRVEYGPVNETSLRGTDKPLPYLFQRREIIKEKFPYLGSKTLDLLAKETAGLYGSQIIMAVEEYLREGKVLNKPKFKFRNPETGEYPEFEFNPFKLKKRLEEVGFSAKLIKPYFYLGYPPFSAKRGHLLNSVGWVGVRVIRAFHPLSILIAPRFEIVARKKG